MPNDAIESPLTRLTELGVTSSIQVLNGRPFALAATVRHGDPERLIAGSIRRVEGSTTNNPSIIERLKLKVTVPCLYNRPLHSVTLDLASGQWCVNLQVGSGLETTAKTVFFDLEREPEPSVHEATPKFAIMNEAHLPLRLSDIIQRQFSFQTPRSSHVFGGTIVGAELADAGIILWVKGDQIFGWTMNRASFSRQEKWLLSLSGENAPEPMKGTITLL